MMDKMTTAQMNTDQFSILESIQAIGELLKDDNRKGSAYSPDRKLSREMETLAKAMNCHPLYALHFAAIFYLTIDEDTISVKNVAEFLKITMPQYKVLLKEIENLMEAELLVIEESYRSRNEYSIPTEVRKKVLSDEIPVARKLETDLYGLAEMAEKCLEKMDRNSNQQQHQVPFLKKLVEANPELPVCAWIRKNKITDNDLIITFLLFTRGLSGNHSHSVRDIANLIARGYRDRNNVRMSLMRGNNVHFKLNVVEWEGDDIQSKEYLVLTDTGKEYLFGDEAVNLVSDEFSAPVKSLKEPEKILAKNLFYNDTERAQLERLEHILRNENYGQVCARLTERKMNAGLCILFYGGPGTGKTESVLQLAKKTGRPVSQVDISSIRDKWVGESEKRAKAVFDDYRRLCKRSKVTPILLLNEADAIINKRIYVERSVDQMSNAIQNIFLEEMERFEGILIATTNLQKNFDAAFDRRFIFKINFEKPSASIRASILRERIPSLTEEDALYLATRHELSGGQVENVARKVVTEMLINGTTPGREEIELFCEEETGFRKSGKRKSGFGFTAA